MLVECEVVSVVLVRRGRFSVEYRASVNDSSRYDTVPNHIPVVVGDTVTVSGKGTIVAVNGRLVSDYKPETEYDRYVRQLRARGK